MTNFSPEEELTKQSGNYKLAKYISGIEIAGIIDSEQKNESSEGLEKFEDQKFTNYSTKLFIPELKISYNRSTDQVLTTSVYSSIILPPPNC